MNTVLGILRESYILLNEMAPYLLFGFFFAGVLHMFIRPETVAAHLGTHSCSSVLKASLFGIPLPLCSCGVIPAALSLRKEGASKGAVLSFLISTPTTGIDSILATTALMGGAFACDRIGATLVTALVAGCIATLLLRDPRLSRSDPPEKSSCKICRGNGVHTHTFSETITELFRYAFCVLLGDVGIWLVAGIFIGGGIAYFLPAQMVQQYLGSSWRAMIIMLIIGIPMYVCATGSIPIAAALMLKGMSPGAAFVFLLAGPATNTVTMTVVGRQLGKEALFIYLGAIAGCSLLLGWILDYLWHYMGMGSLQEGMRHDAFAPLWFHTASSLVLIALIIVNVIRKRMD